MSTESTDNAGPGNEKKPFDKKGFQEALDTGLSKLLGGIKGKDVESSGESFDMSKFLPDAGLVVLPTVKSSSSKNVYTCVAAKDSSLVGVSITLETREGPHFPLLVLVSRYLEVPPASGVSAFENSGEQRPYLMDGVTRDVYMLRKDIMPLCDARVSPWELRYHLDSGIRDQLAAWVALVLQASGAALNCTEEALTEILFSRLSTLADTPSVVWKDLSKEEPKSL